MGEVGEVRDFVVGDIEDTEAEVGLEAGDGRQRVVRDIELF